MNHLGMNFKNHEEPMETFNFTKEDVSVFIASVEVEKEKLKSIDCPDFDCNLYEMIIETQVFQTLKASAE